MSETRIIVAPRKAGQIRTLVQGPAGPQGPQGPAGSAGTISWNETPSGAVDGVNAVFTLLHAPNPSSSLMLFRNGLKQQPGASNDFTISGNTITFSAGAIPQSGNRLEASYPF
jgi:hypothetical protein